MALESQAQLLRREIADLEKELGPDALILRDLRVQLGYLERAERPLSESLPNPVTLNRSRRK